MRRTAPRARSTRLSFLLALGLMAAALHVAQAEEGGEGALPLADTAWRAEAIGPEPTRDHEASTLAFPTADRAVGGAGCNRFHGPVSWADGRIAIGPLAVTKKACPPAVMAQERRYLAALAAARGVEREDDTLRLLDADGRVRVRLRRIGGASEPLAVGEGAPGEGSPPDGDAGRLAP